MEPEVTIFRWLMINPHLIPSVLLFLCGFVMLVLAPIKYQIRKKKLFIFNPIKAIEEYDKYEKAFLWYGAAFAFIGLVSLALISEFYGSYYFKDGIPTFHKG